MTKTQTHVTKGKSNIYEDLGFAPEVAQNMLIRTYLMISIIHWFQQSQMTQVAAAKVLGITQPHLNLILKSDIEAFSLDALVNIASSAGLSVQFSVKAPKTKTNLATPVKKNKSSRKRHSV